MKGLELSRAFYFDKGEPMLKEKYGEYFDQMAVGLVGEGSECFGFDDDISRDHDFGPSFCIWLNGDLYLKLKDDLTRDYNALDPTYLGVPRRNTTNEGEGRVGVLCTDVFYKRYIGLPHFPKELIDWRRLPQENAATATNGEVFYDGLGKFTRLRNKLLDYYPEDVRIQKIIKSCAIASQAGQYNFARTLAHNEFVAATLSMGEFINNAIAAIYLLNKRYMPYYKWKHRGIKDLPKLSITHAYFSRLCDLEIEYREKVMIVEKICSLIIEELRKQGLTDLKDDFLLNHAYYMKRHIKDDEIRALHIMAE